MRKLGISAVVVFVLAFAGAALAGSGSNESWSSRTIPAFGKTVQFKPVDLGDPGFSLGDQTVFSDDLLTTANDRSLGIDGGVCTLVRVADAATQSGTVQCQVTYSLKAGQINAQGLLKLTSGALAGTQVAAITGGTGRFRNAHGESTLEFVRPGEVNITLAIRP